MLMQFTGKGKKSSTRSRGERRSAVPLACAGDSATPNAVQRCAQHFAIVLDGEIQSTPYIDYKRNPDGIPGDNGAQIDMGGGGLGEAKDLALVLQTGALPVKFETAERTDVSATLGKDSLNEAKKAALVGLLVVALFLLVLYRFLGLVAVIGLGIYAAFLYAAILLFNVTLTLPGFAGLILTIGVAADANVVVFERIKEEVRAGKSVRAAIAAGYSKGFHTIIDANVVTAITALVLFAVATAQVQGLRADAADRHRDLAGHRGRGDARDARPARRLPLVQQPALHGRAGPADGEVAADRLHAHALPLVRDLRRDRRCSASARSAVQGPEPRHRLQGRHAAHVQDARSAHDRRRARGDGRRRVTATPSSRAAASATNGDQYKSFQIRTKALSGAEARRRSPVARGPVPDDSARCDDRLVELRPADRASRRSSRSSSRCFLVVLYIAIRFDLKFAGPVIIAMLHDVVICVGIYALLGREVTSSTVAAILTVLGYSIYDTIIIFDRIRENIPLMRRSSFATIANVSLWETIRRSLATTFITLLPVGALFLFGGDTLKDFAFALMVGIAAGAYSSIFIAAPLLTILKEREPEYARRKDEHIEQGRHGGGARGGGGAGRRGARAGSSSPVRRSSTDQTARRLRRSEARTPPAAPTGAPAWTSPLSGSRSRLVGAVR